MVGRLQIEVRPIVFLLSLLCFSGGCSPARDTTDFFYCTDSIESGDIILRKGYGLVSEVVIYQLNDTVDVSHCGIVVLNEKGEFDVIHSLSRTVSKFDGLQICSLSEFMDDSKTETVKVFRYKNDRQVSIQQYAQYYLYEKKAFDESFDMADSTSFCCLELPIHIIRLVDNNDISEGCEKPLFSLFFNKSNFKEIDFVKRKSHLPK